MRNRNIIIFIIILFLEVNNKIAYSQNHSFDRIDLPEKYVTSVAHKVFTDNLGNLLISNEKGIIKWNGNSFEEISGLKGFDDYSAYNIWQDSDGIIWLNTFGEKMICYSNESIIKNPFNSVLKNYKINSSVQDINGNYWFGDRYGQIIKIDKKGHVSIDSTPSKENIHRIHRIEPLKNGNVIAALIFGSFYVLNSKCEIVKKLNWKHDYNWGPANMFCLKNGKVVFCNYKGIHLYSNKLILEKTILFDDYFKGYISDLKEDLDGSLWVASKFGLYKLTNGVFDKHNLTLLIKDYYVNSLSLGIENIIWVATNGNGLLKINKTDIKPQKRNDRDNDIKNLINKDTIKRYNIQVACLDKKSNTIWWAGFRSFGKIYLNGHKTFKYGEVFFSKPRAITLDKSGNIWIGGDGLKVFDTKKESLQTINELNSADVQDCEFIEPYIFIATRNLGIYVIKDFKVVNKYNADNYLYSNNCRKIIHDGKNFYFTIEHRIYRYEFKGKSIKNISVLDFNFKNLEIINITESNENFICSTKDSSWKVNLHNDKYPIEFSLKSNGIRLKPNVFNKIKFHNNETILGFSCATFQNQDLLCFRYKILKDGHGSNWIVTLEKNVNLIGLEPGNYTFILENSFDKFNWNKSEAVRFEIIPPYWKTTWFKVIVICFIFMLLSLFFLDRINIERNKRLTAEIKLKALQSQMNPHFIFNSLNAIQQFIFSNDVTKSNHYLSRFASLMRKCYEYANLKIISLKDEINFLENYLEIEMLRFDEKFKYEIKILPELNLNDKIPPLLIQPIVENSIKHGFKKLKEGGMILISFEVYNNVLKVIVSDNGTGDESGRANNERGSLRRLQERFELLNNTYRKKEIGLEYQSILGQGTTVILNIPILKN